MQAAKETVAKIAGHGGHSKTDVDERVNPAVTNETIKPTRLEETTKAVDKEVHQDHYHTTVQPVTDSQTLPEKHTHQVAPQVERSYQQNNPEEDKKRVESELGAFQNTTKTMPATTSASAAQVSGEHVHHHVHETVQPVINKETIAPEVVHTTIPVHEKHIAASEHHGTSVLPTKSLSEFTEGSSGSRGVLPEVLQGGAHRHEEYEGAPRAYKEELQKK